MSDAHTGGRPVPGDDYPYPHFTSPAFWAAAEAVVDVPAGVATCPKCWHDGSADEMCPAHTAEYQTAELDMALGMALRMHQVQFERANRLEAERDALQQRIDKARHLAEAARALVPHGSYTGVGWRDLLDAIDEP